MNRRLSSAPSQRNEPVLQSAYIDGMQQIFFGRLSLYATRLVAQGWTWRGRFQQNWALDHMEGVEWLHGSSRGNLVLKFKDGQRYFVTVKGPGTWHYLLGSSLKTV